MKESISLLRGPILVLSKLPLNSAKRISIMILYVSILNFFMGQDIISSRESSPEINIKFRNLEQT